MPWLSPAGPALALLLAAQAAPPAAHKAPPSGAENAWPPAVVEEVEVKGRRGGDPGAPVGVSSAVVQPGDAPSPPATISDLAVSVPGVMQNGQGGLFQVISIRGVSRQRVQSQLGGIRLTSERRAGVSASFLDPLLLDSLDVLRGPASSYYGSGALGGVLQIFPRGLDAPFAAAGYETQGDAAVLAAGDGGEHWSAALAHRNAGDGTDGNGNRLRTGFTQTSAVFSGTWGKGPRRYSLLYVPAYADDIGKPSKLEPDRVTTYPRERHNLVSLAVDGERWSALAAVHPHDLETLVQEAGAGESTVRNRTVDVQGRLERRIDLSHGLDIRLGADIFARRDVNADETVVPLDPNLPVTTAATLDDARSTEAGLFGTVQGPWGRATWEAGGRFTALSQSNAGSARTDDTAGSGFFGVSIPLAGRLTLEAHLGSGLRFPSLSERYFSGSTGRGEVVANPDLEPERSLTSEIGLRWVSRQWLLSGDLFRTAIDRYIDRITLPGGERTFVNLTSGTIVGIEGQATWQPSTAWRLLMGGHSIDGEDDDGNPLADIPQDEVFAGLRWTAGRVVVAGRGTVRFRKTDPGSSEDPIDGAYLLGAGITVRLDSPWHLEVYASNLLDQAYYPSADEDAALAPGRSVGLRLRWLPGSRQAGG